MSTSPFKRNILVSLFALGLWCLQIVSGHAADTQKKYGRFLFAEYEVPATVVSKYASFKPSPPAKGESAIVSTLLADTVDWQGPVFKADPSNNPYTISIQVLGTAKAAGDVATMWQAGWNIEDRMQGPQQRLVPLAGVGKSDVKAGEIMMLSGAAGPVSFSESKEANVVLGFVNARNLEIHSVKVQVWSGIAQTSWVETLLAFRWLLVPLVMFALIWWFRRS